MSKRNVEFADPPVIFYIGDQPYTASDLGDDLLDMDIRHVFQAVVDRGMLPGVQPGSPWYEHIRFTADGSSSGARAAASTELVQKLRRERQEAEKALAADDTPENRARVSEAHRRVRMAVKLATE